MRKSWRSWLCHWGTTVSPSPPFRPSVTLQPFHCSSGFPRLAGARSVQPLTQFQGIPGATTGNSPFCGFSTHIKRKKRGRDVAYRLQEKKAHPRPPSRPFGGWVGRCAGVWVCGWASKGVKLTFPSCFGFRLMPLALDDLRKVKSVLPED